ncbi:RNA polymerase II transcription factor SIII subunit A-domain-containing protein [Exophiala viscosa]|uniref:RNA polymerase II transcription factor SIII subunit A-domain-containing protein n=1 Tax=Exophiala viscosa TaxID=2486360 RepID=A0AAN6DWH8_9EURO|nr:RNA polymerase II transcription factor SIII subunit A-domain-containing protein [Exophiala viscosa]
MPADSLVDMARRACARYSARITDIGDLDYQLIRSVLLKIESPEKLHQLEQASPQIIGKDAEIWMNFIKRDIPDWQQKRHEPNDPKNWWKVYRKLKEEAQMDSTADEAMLKAALANIKNEKELNTTQIASKMPVPGVARRTRTLYNYISGRTGSKGANKMTLMEKIRKEARDAKASKMNKPMHELQKRATPVTQAPQRFVEELKQKSTPRSTPPPGPTARTSRPPLHAPRKISRPEVSSYDLTQDREARLRALKSGRPMESNPRATPTSNGTLTTNFLEDSDLDDVEDDVAPAPRDRDLLKVNDDRSRSASPMKLQPNPLKRKQAPSLFMSSPKRVVKAPGVS